MKYKMNIIEAIGIRDYCMWELENIYKTFPTSPIEKLIDDSTGFSKDRKDSIIELLEELLKALEITGDDKTSITEFLKELKK